MRDKNGGYKLDVPALPPALIGEDGEELGELEAEDGGESSMLDAELSGRDKESGLPYFQWLMVMFDVELGRFWFVLMVIVFV